MHSGTEHTLDTLMARLADGDRSAFSEVFKRLWAPVERLCLNLLRNEADAADAAQQALAKIFERASDYDRGRPALPWALAIAAWECRTLRRRLLRRREVSDEVVTEPHAESVQDQIVQRDLAQAALAAMGELSENDREALIATFWDESAAVSGATLRKRRERALARLREAWRKLYGSD
jgi:RNA polymerase sigma-70 factor (ECF subfamily)